MTTLKITRGLAETQKIQLKNVRPGQVFCIYGPMNLYLRGHGIVISLEDFHTAELDEDGEGWCCPHSEVTIVDATLQIKENR